MFKSIWFYTILPLYIQLSLLLVFFNIPYEMLSDVLFLPFVFTFFSVFFSLFLPKNIDFLKSIYIERWTLDKKYLLFFCWFIVFLVPFDIYFNGFKILNPLTYAEFHGIGRFIRHITNFSWLIALFAAVNYKRSIQFKILLLISILMPILFVDRNRLLMCFFNIIIVWFFLNIDNIKRIKLKLFLFVFLILWLFSFIGTFRSGSSFYVPTSGVELRYGYYPLKDIFYYFSAPIQQVILYITTPLFNFSHMMHLHFTSDVFLLKQMSFMNRDAFPDYPYSPVLITRYNVGTEFFPILLYAGPLAVIASVAIVFLYFSAFYVLLDVKPNIYTLALFVKIAYVLLLIGFAPQFFIIYNFISLVFLILIFISVFVLVFMTKPFLKLRY